MNSNLELIVAERTDQLRESNQRSQIQSIMQAAFSAACRRIRTGSEKHSAMAIVWQPKDVVGGDFYWHKTIGDRNLLSLWIAQGMAFPVPS